MSLFGKKRGEEPRGSAAQILEERKHLLTPNSDFFIREAYKTLRTNVSFALAEEDTEGCKVIVVTSALQSEGKSVTAMNLAISYAMAEQRVLVIDCDLRRPKLARLLDLNAKAGLSDLLVDPSLREQAILSTQTKGLDVILAGTIPPNPSELLGSQRMAQLLSDLRERYDFIILDSTPVNVVTDGVVLATQSDGVIFLVRANKSERGSVVHAVEQLSYAKVKILGIVLNGVEMGQTHYGYRKYGYQRYSRYGKGYGYGYGYGYTARPYREEEFKNR